MGNTNHREKFCTAIKYSKEPEIRSILKTYPELINAHINLNNDHTPLAYAASFNAVESGRVLVELGAEVDKVSKKDLSTAAIIAARFNHLDFLKFLIDNNADLTVVNSDKLNCLDVAVIYMNYKTAYYLIHVKKMILNSEDFYFNIQNELNLRKFNLPLFVDSINNFVEPDKVPVMTISKKKYKGNLFIIM